MILSSSPAASFSCNNKQNQRFIYLFIFVSKLEMYLHQHHIIVILLYIQSPVMVELSDKIVFCCDQGKTSTEF